MKNEPQRLQKLKQRHADLQLKIRREQQKLARAERRLETRRKILIGGAALTEMKKDATWGQRLTQRLDETLEHENDRALFALPLHRVED